jgi:putative membrane protein
MNRMLAVSFAVLMVFSGVDTKRVSAQEPLGTDDLLFLQRAAKGGFLEVSIGKLALENAESQAVKNLGQRMIDDHTRANQELQMIAQRKGVKMPAEDASPLINMPMAKVTGSTFDALFRKGMIEDHEKDIAMFQMEITSGTDLDIKNWASKTVITIKQHLADAKALPE